MKSVKSLRCFVMITRAFCNDGGGIFNDDKAFVIDAGVTVVIAGYS